MPAIVEVDGKPVMMDNGQQLEYFPLELKLNLTGSSYVKTAGARMAKYELIGPHIPTVDNRITTSCYSAMPMLS